MSSLGLWGSDQRRTSGEYKAVGDDPVTYVGPHAAAVDYTVNKGEVVGGFGGALRGAEPGDFFAWRFTIGAGAGGVEG